MKFLETLINILGLKYNNLNLKWKNIIFAQPWFIAYIKIKPAGIQYIPEPCHAIGNHFALVYELANSYNPFLNNGIKFPTKYHIHPFTSVSEIITKPVLENAKILIQTKQNGIFVSKWMPFKNIPFTCDKVADINIMGTNKSQYLSKWPYLVDDYFFKIIPSYKGDIYFAEHRQKLMEIFPEIKKHFYDPTMYADLTNNIITIVTS